MSQTKIGTYRIIQPNTISKLSILIILVLLTSTITATQLVKTIRQDPIGSPGKLYPDLSSSALSSMFAKVNGFSNGNGDIEDGAGDHNGEGSTGGPPSVIASHQLNEHVNLQRPRDEPSVTVNPNNGVVVAGANDYGIGGPVGGGVYTHTPGQAFPAESYFPPFPILCAGGTGGNCIYLAPPLGTGDPTLAFSQKTGKYFYTSIGFSADNCASGVFIYRSPNGLDWTRPIVPRLGGLRTVVYWDGGPTGQDCSTFHDKSWMVIDNSPASPFYGRIYVTWTQFKFDPSASVYMESPIVLAYSDNNGETFTNPIDITGTLGNTNCLFPSNPANAGRCREDQFSSPVVGADGTVYVAFINDQFSSGPREQYLVSRVHPAATPGGFVIDGPFQATFPVYDVNGLDLPTQTTGGQGRATLCNSNFRVSSTESLAINTANGKLFIAWSDDRAHAGEFSGVTVGPRSSGYACPVGKNTDTDVFIISSSNGGSSWTAPTQVNQDKGPNTVNNKDQFYPWVSANAKGQVVVLYLDRRYDNTPIPNKLSRATVGYTTDLVHWSETLVQPEFASNFDNAFTAGAFIGDYNDVLILDSGNVYGVWVGVQPGKTFEGNPALASDIFIAIYNVNTHTNAD